MSEDQNTKFSHKVKVTARDVAHFDELIEQARDMYGQRGRENGWWWKVDGKYKDRKLVFMFKEKSDAVIFKLCI